MACVVPSEPAIINLLRNHDILEIKLCRRGDHIALIDSAHRNSVDLVGTSDEQMTASSHLLQEDDSPSTKLSQQQDEYGSRGDVLAHFDEGAVDRISLLSDQSPHDGPSNTSALQLRRAEGPFLAQLGVPFGYGF